MQVHGQAQPDRQQRYTYLHIKAGVFNVPGGSLTLCNLLNKNLTRQESTQRESSQQQSTQQDATTRGLPASARKHRHTA